MDDKTKGNLIILFSLTVAILVIACVITAALFPEAFMEIFATYTVVCSIGIIIFVIIFILFFLFILGYFTVVKKPEIQQTGDYSLDDTIDSKDYNNLK